MKKLTLLLLLMIGFAQVQAQNHAASKSYFAFAFMYVENNTLLITDVVEIKGIGNRAQLGIFKSDNNNRFIRFVKANHRKIYQSQLPSYQLNTIIVSGNINQVRKNHEEKIKRNKNKFIYVKKFKFNQLFGKANKRDFSDY